MSTTQFPLREKRKAATRKSLIRSAQTLFASQGYEQTTLEEVAGHAGLHVQTLYRHFASKQELATAGDEDLLERFTRAIRDPARTNTTFTFWREWVGQATQRITQDDGGQQFREFLLQRWTQPLVSSQLIRIGHEYEDLLTESLARDFALPADEINTARLVAVMLWGVNSHIQRLHARQPDFDLAREAVAVIESVEALFGHMVQS
jgi:AcrR family transcriptional regulator